MDPTHIHCSLFLSTSNADTHIFCLKGIPNLPPKKALTPSRKWQESYQKTSPTPKRKLQQKKTKNTHLHTKKKHTHTHRTKNTQNTQNTRNTRNHVFLNGSIVRSDIRKKRLWLSLCIATSLLPASCAQ